MTESAGDATRLAEDGVASGCDAVVAVGGDGTLNEVGRALIGTGVPMGVIPTGSGNALARALGISLDRRIACKQLSAGRVRSIDVGRFGCETFLSTAGAGLDAVVCRRFNHRSGRRGILPYIRHSVGGFLSYKAEPVRIYLDGSEEGIEIRPTLLTVANTPTFGYGATIAPGASPDDGFLDVVVVEGMTVFRAASNAHRLFNGTFDRAPGVTMYRVKHLRIEREEPGVIQVDGETREGGATLDVSVVPGGLQVIVPG